MQGRTKKTVLASKQENESLPYFDKLSKEILFYIFSFLSAKELFGLCTLSLQMKTSVESYDKYWKSKIQLDFPKVEPTYQGFYNNLFKQAEKKIRAKEEKQSMEVNIHSIIDNRFRDIVRQDNGLPPLDKQNKKRRK
ncbi:MAG: hypothetical protein A3F11_01520 [Gammaproteobacteria bacterium RIFCSPHIGHO2_12_FULL_37_14]|nr:MAG: hypothetical protein A3F11_01520 [Gammaproteobacteria bacterium RIFCSPHIGHO2_12_FULL_37_14]